ncbi:phosphotransferase [Streptomyces chartreusis]|uniref:phosphotransferase n=1 Tax=Streptomyces chartreusis TaxID=1969 RepID=UPI002E175F13
MQLPSLSDLLGDALPALLTACRRHTGLLTRIERVHGGNVSHVFRVRGEHTSVILKIRTDRFARMPLSTDPALIDDERRTLEVYGGIAPSVFPQVLGFHASAHAMILADVFPDGRSYHEHLAERPATAEEMSRLGGTLRRVHHATRDTDTAFRSHSDQWFREHSFVFCLRAPGHAVLTQACEELAALPHHQLVLGDVAPKNLSLAGGAVAFCDLDNAHRGWPLFDVAYFLAHLLIHHLGQDGHVRTLVPALLTAYFGAGPEERLSSSDELLMAKIVAGVALYRLDQTVPYALPRPAALTDRFRDRILHFLGNGTFTVQDLVRAAGDPAQTAI